MPLDLGPVKKWFGYNRKERRASYILLVLVMIVLLIRLTVPEKNMDVEDLTPTILSAISTSRQEAGPLFSFDPNTASYDTLLLLGFGEREAGTLISYRNKGGRFRRPSDISRIYGLDSSKAKSLIPFIHIEPGGTYNIRYDQKKTIDLNRCDSAELEGLPGIGPVLAARIIKYRDLLGGYAEIDQLKEVYGLSSETYEMIRHRVLADSSEVQKINVNTADYKQLSRIPYMRRYQLTDILKYRELTGGIRNLQDLVKNNLIADSLVRKIRPYVVF